MRVIKPMIAVAAVAFSLPALAAYGPSHAHHVAKHQACMSGDSMLEQHVQGNGVHGTDRCKAHRLHMSGAADVQFSNVRLENGTISHTDSFARLNNAHLHMNADIADGFAMHMNVRYLDNTLLDDVNARFSASAPLSDRDTFRRFDMDEAFITYHKFATSPVFARVGKQYLDFGHYDDPYTSLPSLTQALTQINDSAITLGFASNSGLNGSVFAYDRPLSSGSTLEKSSVNKWGVSLGYANKMNGADYRVGFSMINDGRTVAELDDGGLSPNVLGHFIDADKFTSSAGRKSVYNINGEVKFEGIRVGANYTAFSGDLNGADTKPSLFGVNAGYSFDMGGYKSCLNAGYERAAKRGQNALLAKTHWDVGYDVDVAEGTKLGVHYAEYKMHTADNKARYFLVGLKARV